MMQESLKASKNGVSFRRSTFDPARLFRNAWRGLLWRLELLGRAKTCAELCRMGYYEQAKKLMLDLTKYK